MTKKKKDGVEEVKKQMTDIMNSIEVENLINRNEVIFSFDGSQYKVRKPSFREKQEAFQQKLKKYTSLLTDDSFMLEEALITIYKKKGINIDAITEKIQQTYTDKNNLMLKLGEALKDSSSDKETETYKNEIEELDDKMQLLTIEKTNLLGASIEHQTMIFYFTYLAYVSTEKQGKKDKWEKAWKTFEEYENSDSGLVDKACYYTSLIAGHEEPVL